MVEMEGMRRMSGRIGRLYSDRRTMSDIRDVGGWIYFVEMVVASFICEVPPWSGRMHLLWRNRRRGLMLLT